MKKVCSLFLAVLFIASLTGCGSSSKNEITCTTEKDGVKVVATVRTDKDDKVTGVKMSTEMAASSKEELDTTYELMKMAEDEMNKNDGVKYSISKKDLKLIMTVDLDFNKASDEVKSELSMDDIDTTGAEFKKNAEAEGATCK